MGRQAAEKKSKRTRGAPITESLLITDAEKHETSKSMYGDSAARISSNVFAIQDRLRHRAYDVLFRSIKGKRVLHLGCGMGLYAMLAIKAHAAQVVAVDRSSVVDAARVVAKQNGLENITFLRGHLKDVLNQLPEGIKFDVILCEWMGTFLLNDRLLTDAVYARDHLLASGGSVCPNQSSLHICGVSDYYFRVETEDYWSNVYGFSMEPMKKLVKQEVEVCTIPSKNIVTNTHRLTTVQLDDVTGLNEEEQAAYRAASERDQDDPILTDSWLPIHDAAKGFTASFEITATQNSVVNYLTFFVDAVYASPSDAGANFVMGINPGGPQPWVEASVGLLEPLPVTAGEKITGTLTARTPVEKGGKVTVVEVTARTEGKVAAIETTGQYIYQAY